MLQMHLDRLRAWRESYLAVLEASNPEDLPLKFASGQTVAGLLLTHGNPLPEPHREAYLSGALLQQLQVK